MSAVSRSAYLLAIANKAITRVQPLIDEFNKIKDLKEEVIEELDIQVRDLEAKIVTEELKNNSAYVANLRQQIDELIVDSMQQLGDFIEITVNSIVESLSRSVEFIDGISLEAEVDIPTLALSINITPDPINMTTDFVKNTILDPLTNVAISTAVTGTAGSLAVVGVGTQLATIQTT